MVVPSSTNLSIDVVRCRAVVAGPPAVLRLLFASSCFWFSEDMNHRLCLPYSLSRALWLRIMVFCASFRYVWEIVRRLFRAVKTKNTTGRKKRSKLGWGTGLIDKPVCVQPPLSWCRCWGRAGQSESAPPPNFFCFGEGHAFACEPQPFCSHSDNSRETPRFVTFLFATPVSQPPQRSNHATTTLSFPSILSFPDLFYLVPQCRTTATMMRAAHRK